jgi:hypothetical protein
LKEIERRFRGRIRQRRSEKFSLINEAANLTTEYLIKYFEDKKSFLLRVQSESFKVLIMSTKKDMQLAFMNANHMLALYPRQILSIEIITQDAQKQGKSDSRILIVDEDSFLSNHKVVETFNAFGERKNWVKQQYLKMKYVAKSDMPILILDADTFLVQPIFLFSKSLHTLLIDKKDFHYPYTAHARRFFNQTQPLLNFTNHLQIQFPSYYNLMFPVDFDLDWIKQAMLGRIYGEDSPFSEFQTYAGAVLSQKTHEPLFVLLDHDTYDVTNLSLPEIEKAFKDYKGNVFTVGNKLSTRD